MYAFTIHNTKTFPITLLLIWRFTVRHSEREYSGNKVTSNNGSLYIFPTAQSFITPKNSRIILLHCKKGSPLAAIP